MPTTSNFGWTTPADTDLVKDGALAIRTLGNGIDTSMAELKGGTTGQVLSKTSNTDMDFTWVTTDDANAIQNAIVDAKGDLITATAADTPARLAVGANDTVLTADSSTATGLKWATANGMTLLATTALTGGSVTISSLTGYKELYFVFKDVYLAADSYIECRFNGDSGSNYGYQFIQFTGATIASNGGGNAAGTGLVGFVGNTSTNTALFQGSMRVAAVDQTNGVSWFATNSYYDTTNNATLAIGRYKNSAVISSATFYSGSSTYSGGTLLTYGVK